MAKKQGAKLRLNLALQGGGAHGAFTWGVLDRLLDDPDIEVEGVSATSAGAMNGAMYTTGLKIGGAEEARARLRRFWDEIRDAYPLNRPPWSHWLQAFNAPPYGAALPPSLAPSAFFNPAAYNPMQAFGAAMSQFFSPYQANLLDINPLRHVLEAIIDFEQVSRAAPPQLFVCATDVASGRARIFKGREISIEALLASACLPTLYRAVEIDGREYWDGGYTGNPALWPLIYDCAAPDILIVHVNPIVREDLCHTAQAIQTRMNEISFNSNLLAELRAIDTIDRLAREGRLPEGRYKRMRIHAVADPETMRELRPGSKATPNGAMLDRLFTAGRRAMERWLEEHKDKIGVKSSVKLREDYL